jgi:hypothetical protein
MWWVASNPTQRVSSFSDVNQTVEYHNLTSTAERDIFQRVQLGMSLTAAGESR